jgi:hypothetical protein
MHVIYADHVYKWVDEKGQIHYGEKEPANLSIEKITIEQPPPVDESLQHQRMEKQKKLLESFDKNRAAEKEKKEQDKAAREVKRQYCEDARRHLRFLEQADGARLARPSETGDIHWVSDVEREMLIEHWRNRVQTLCK